MSDGTNGQRAGLVGGRFSRPPSEEMARFSSSLAVDLRMLDEDVDGSVAHVTMLGEVGILSIEEAERLREGLEQVRAEIKSGAFVPDDSQEDVHMAVETRLTEIVGEVGKKLHTARSRNDQVATDVRLWLRRRLAFVDQALERLLAAILRRVELDGGILMPGYTHLQRGQPILLGHHLLAHAWAFSRDRERLHDACRRLDRSPLGACAMAGTPHPIDRQRTAEMLGFAGLVENAMDAVSARDHEQEVAAACSIAMVHVSRLAEELVIWSSSEFKFVRLGEAYVTGSSIMPQKRNPDAAELLRGKSARVIGALQGLLVLTKGTPLSYNRDFQEDRGLLFDAVETTFDCLHLLAGVIATAEFAARRFEEEMAFDTSLATELADLLASRGVPFREAHEAVGRLVRYLDENGRDLRSLTPEIAVHFHPALEGPLGEVLDPRKAAERRISRGGTASVEIARQLELLRSELGP